MVNENKANNSLTPEVIDILLKQYEQLWANIRHNETVRDHLYNFYLVAFSFLMLGSFELLKIRKEFLPDLPNFVIIFPFLVISFVGIITIAIQARLRLVLNRDGKAADTIRKFLTESYPSMSTALSVYNKYFDDRPKSIFHKLFNLSRLVIYLVTGTITFSSGIGTFLATYDICFTLFSIALTLIISGVVSVLFEKQSFYVSKIALSNKELY